MNKNINKELNLNKYKYFKTKDEIKNMCKCELLKCKNELKNKGVWNDYVKVNGKYKEIKDPLIYNRIHIILLKYRLKN